MAQNDPFPRHDMPLSEKLQPKWGLQAARAIFSHNENEGPRLFHKNTRRYDELSRWYHGNIDESEFMPFLYADPKQDPKQSWLRGIDWQIVNYLSKRVDNAVSKIAQVQYDPIVSINNVTAKTEQKEYELHMEFLMKEREFMESIGVRLETAMPAGMDKAMIPKNDSELEMLKMMTPKHYAAMKIEMGIAFHLDRLNYQEIKRHTAWDLTVFGASHISMYMPENLYPMAKRVDIRRSIVPVSDKPDLRDIPYIADIDEWTMADIAGNFPEVANDPKLYERIATHHASRRHFGSYQDTYFTNLSELGLRSDNVERVRLMHFKIHSHDEAVYVEQQDQFGNKIVREKGYHSNRTKEQIAQFKARYGNKRRMVRKSYPVVLEGWWIIGSDILLGYGQKINTATGDCKEDQLGDKVYAPNMYDQQITSMVEKSLPLVRKIHKQHLKMEHVLGLSRTTGININLAELRKVNLKNRSGEEMSHMELIDMFLQMNILITDDDGRASKPGTRKAVDEIRGTGGEELIKHMNILQGFLNQLDEVMGYNPASLGSALSPEMGKAVTEAQIEQTNQTLEYLFNADQEFCKGVYKQIGKLHAISDFYCEDGRYDALYGNSPTYGKGNLSKYTFAFNIEPRPTKGEWNQFYQSVLGKEAGSLISPEDVAVIYEMKNLKQARMYLAIAQKRRAAQMHEREMEKITANNEGSKQAALAAKELELKKEEMKAAHELRMKELEKELLFIQHEHKMKEKKLELDMTGNTKETVETIRGTMDMQRELVRQEAKLEE